MAVVYLIGSTPAVPARVRGAARGGMPALKLILVI